jgi:hypothetical protein
MVVMSLLMQPVLVAVKVNGTRLQDASWLALLIPLWCFGGLVLLFWGWLAVITRSKVVLFKSLEYSAWFSGSIVLACIWDGLVENVNWFIASIPFYMGILFRVLQSVEAISEGRGQQDKMITPGRHHQLIHDYRELLHQHRPVSDEEQQQNKNDNRVDDDQGTLIERFPTEDSYMEHLQNEYIIVTLNQEAFSSAVTLMQMPDDNGHVEPLSEDDLELLRIQLSEEFQALDEALKEERKNMVVWFILGISFLTQVAHKLETLSNTSWWIIFIPFWLYYGIRLLSSCFVCCCVPISGEPIVVQPRDGEDDSRDENPATQSGVSSSEVNAPASMEFASPEGDMREFMEKTTNQDLAVKEKGLDDKKSGTGKAGQDIPFGLALATEMSDAVGQADIKVESQAEKPSSNEATLPEKTDEPSGANEPEIDFEEAFHAWQQAHAESQQRAMDQQTKAISSFCWTLLQIVVVTCIVARLQDSYDGDTGFNALWILFPFFFVAGIILCCCASFIYGAGRDSLNIVVERAKGDDGEEHVAESQDTPEVDATTPSPDVSSSGAVVSAPVTEEHETCTDVATNAETSGQTDVAIDDLD